MEGSMSYTKDWRAYPPAFVTLIEAAHLREVRVPCADSRDAKRLEGRLHAFFGVLHRSADKSGAEPEIKTLDNIARQIKIKAVGLELVAIPRDMEQDNQLILAALGSPPPQQSADLASMSPEMREMFAKTLTTP
jgi:hypothetical protein